MALGLINHAHKEIGERIKRENGSGRRWEKRVENESGRNDGDAAGEGRKEDAVLS